MSATAQVYLGWYSRNIGQVRDSLQETERAYRLDVLNPMSANLLGLARMAAGERCGGRSCLRGPHYARARDEFPGCEPHAGESSSLVTGRRSTDYWILLRRYPLREFQDGVAFIQAKRNPTPENIGGIRNALEAHREKDRLRRRLAARVCRASGPHRRSVPNGGDRAASVPWEQRTTSWALTATARRSCSMPACPNCATILGSCRFARGCGLVEFWLATGKWPDCVDEVGYDFKAECQKARHIPIQEFGF